MKKVSKLRILLVALILLISCLIMALRFELKIPAQVSSFAVYTLLIINLLSLFSLKSRSTE